MISFSLVSLISFQFECHSLRRQTNVTFLYSLLCFINDLDQNKNNFEWRPISHSRPKCCINCWNKTNTTFIVRKTGHKQFSVCFIFQVRLCLIRVQYYARFRRAAGHSRRRRRRPSDCEDLHSRLRHLSQSTQIPV